MNHNKNCIRVHPYTTSDNIPLCAYGSCTHIILPGEKICPCHELSSTPLPEPLSEATGTREYLVADLWEKELQKYDSKMALFSTVPPKQAHDEIKSFLRSELARAAEEEKAKRWEMPCKGCGTHPSFWKTMVESKEWQEWEKVANEKGFDYDESRELGAFSPNHRDAFFSFIKEEERVRIIDIINDMPEYVNIVWSPQIDEFMKELIRTINEK